MRGLARQQNIFRHISMSTRMSRIQHVSLLMNMWCSKVKYLSYAKETADLLCKKLERYFQKWVVDALYNSNWDILWGELYL